MSSSKGQRLVATVTLCFFGAVIVAGLIVGHLYAYGAFGESDIVSTALAVTLDIIVSLLLCVVVIGWAGSVVGWWY